MWRSGFETYCASRYPAWSLCPGAADLLPVRAHRLSALVTLVWELCFPVLAVLVLGVVFHIGTLLTLEVGRFSLYAIACYAAFVYWERFRPSESDAKQNSPLT